MGTAKRKEKRRKKTVGVAAAAARNVQGNGNAKGKGNAKEGMGKMRRGMPVRAEGGRAGAGQEAETVGAELSGQTDNNQNG